VGWAVWAHPVPTQLTVRVRRTLITRGDIGHARAFVDFHDSSAQPGPACAQLGPGDGGAKLDDRPLRVI